MTITRPFPLLLFLSMLYILCSVVYGQCHSLEQQLLFGDACPSDFPVSSSFSSSSDPMTTTMSDKQIMEMGLTREKEGEEEGSAEMVYIFGSELEASKARDRKSIRMELAAIKSQNNLLGNVHVAHESEWTEFMNWKENKDKYYEWMMEREDFYEWKLIRKNENSFPFLIDFGDISVYLLGTFLVAFFILYLYWIFLKGFYRNWTSLVLWMVLVIFVFYITFDFGEEILKLKIEREAIFQNAVGNPPPGCSFESESGNFLYIFYNNIASFYGSLVGSSGRCLQFYKETHPDFLKSRNYLQALSRTLFKIPFQVIILFAETIGKAYYSLSMELTTFQFISLHFFVLSAWTLLFMIFLYFGGLQVFQWGKNWIFNPVIPPIISLKSHDHPEAVSTLENVNSFPIKHQPSHPTSFEAIASFDGDEKDQESVNNYEKESKESPDLFESNQARMFEVMEKVFPLLSSSFEGSLLANDLSAKLTGSKISSSLEFGLLHFHRDYKIVMNYTSGCTFRLSLESIKPKLIER